MDEVVAQKNALRKKILYLRRSMPSAAVAQESNSITKNLLEFPLFQKAHNIMVYVAMPDEPRTDAIITNSLQLSKTVSVPSIKGNGIMNAGIIRSLADLVPGKYNIPTPNPETFSIMEPSLLDVIIVPGVAFNYHGQRLGMGAGFYDRFLPKATHAIRISLALSCQLTKHIPCNTYDCSVNYIINKDGVINCAGKM